MAIREARYWSRPAKPVDGMPGCWAGRLRPSRVTTANIVQPYRMPEMLPRLYHTSSCGGELGLRDLPCANYVRLSGSRGHRRYELAGTDRPADWHPDFRVLVRAKIWWSAAHYSGREARPRLQLATDLAANP